MSAGESSIGEAEGIDDAYELVGLGVGRPRHLERVDDEALTAQVEDPEPIDLPRSLLEPRFRPAQSGPAAEVRNREASLADGT